MVASVHSNFGLSREADDRPAGAGGVQSAGDDAGAPTGRLLLARDGYDVDLDAVIDAAAKAGTMIEINANPHRLDLDAVHCRRAREKGVTIVINPDAHSVGGLDDLEYGVSVARRGWLEKDDVWNTAALEIHGATHPAACRPELTTQCRTAVVSRLRIRAGLMRACGGVGASYNRKNEEAG